MGSITIRKSLLVLFLLAGLMLVISNVLLARRLAQLQRLDDLLNTPNKLEAGSTVPAIVGYDVNGKKVSYGFGEDMRDTLVLVFSPGCHACDENWPNWIHLIKENGESTRLLAVNIASGLPITSEYIARHEIGGIPIVAEVSAESLQAYRMAYTPQTILIGRDGKVRKVLTGQLKSETFALRGNCSGESRADCSPKEAASLPH